MNTVPKERKVIRGIAMFAQKRKQENIIEKRIGDMMYMLNVRELFRRQFNVLYYVLIFMISVLFPVSVQIVQANAGNPCNPVKEPSDIDELIEMSDFVALYRVTGVSKLKVDGGASGRDEDKFLAELSESILSQFVYEYKLSDVTSLLGKAPRELVVRGASPPTGIPGSFFFMKDRHGALALTGDLIHGSSPQGRDANGNCQFLPRMVTGYYYLVFGGVNSRAAYEPILDLSYDPFYLEVKKKIRKHKE